LVERAEEHGNLDIGKEADHVREHGIVRTLPEERETQEHVAPGTRIALDGIAAKCRRQFVREQDADKFFGDRFARFGKDINDISLLGDDASVDDRNAVTDVLDDLHFVRDDDDRQSHAAVDVTDEREDGLRRLRIER